MVARERTPDSACLPRRAHGNGIAAADELAGAARCEHDSRHFGCRYGNPDYAVIEPDGRTLVQSSAHRLVGCALGVLMGLFRLYWVDSNFLVWLLLLMGGVWLTSQIQWGNTGVGYMGTQAGLAFLLSMIQGQGPPLSPIPGIDRFAGIMAGLSVLLVITMVMSLFRLAPAPPRTGAP